MNGNLKSKLVAFVIFAFMAKYTVVALHDCAEVNPFSASSNQQTNKTKPSCHEINTSASTHQHDDCDICKTFTQLSIGILALSAFIFYIFKQFSKLKRAYAAILVWLFEIELHSRGPPLLTT